MAKSQFRASNLPWHLIIIFLLLGIGIGTSGYLYYKDQKEQIKKTAEDGLYAIADLKVSQIVSWRKERLGDAAVITESLLISSGVHQFLENPKDSGLRRNVLTWMTSLQKNYEYERVMLFDKKGIVKLSIPGKSKMVCSLIQQSAEEVIKTKRIILTDFHKSDPIGSIHLGLIAPLLVQQGRNILPVGVLLLEINPYRFLYPFIQSWPTPSETSETLLIRREGDEVVYLNELRHRKNTALNLRFPLSREQLPAAMVVQGKEGVVEGLDYRGVPVIAAMRKIPESPWFFVAKVNEEEIYKPIQEKAWIVTILSGLIIGFAGITLGLIWRHQRAQSYHKLYEGELERGKLTQRLDFLTKHANDMIVLLDDERKIVDVNDRAVESYGYTRDELLQRSGEDLRPPEFRPFFDEQIEQVNEHNGFLYETLHQKKDGTTFPVEVSSRPIWVGEKKFYQSIIRNITERKRAEKALQESEKKYRQVIENATEIIYTVDGKGNFTYANPAGLKVTGFSLEELQSFNYTDLVMPGHRQRVAETYADQFRQKRPTAHVEFPFFNKAGGITWFSQNSTLVIEDGKVVGFHIIARDVTEQKRIEEALEMTQFSVEHASESVFWIDSKGHLDYVNEAACLSLGFSRKELLSMSIWDIDPDFNRERWSTHWQGLPKRGPSVRESHYRTKEGKIFPIEITGDYLKYGEKEYNVAFVRDITDRKKADDSLRESVETLRAFLNANPEVSFLIDAKGTVLVANESLFKRFSKSSEEIIGSCLYDLFPEDVTKKRKYHFDEVFRTGKPVHFEDVRMDRNYETFVHPVFDKEGHVGAVAVLGFDITERKQTEEALRSSEEKYRTILENIEEGYYEVDLAGNFTFLNESMCRIYGYPKEELMGMNDRQYTDKENAKRTFETFNKVYRTGEPQIGYDYAIIRKDGAKRYVETSILLQKDSSGKPLGFRGIIRDITDRKLAEQALRENEEKFQELFDEAPVGYHEYNKEGRITRVNRTELEMLGYTVEEMVGQPVWKFVVEEKESKAAAMAKLDGLLPPGRQLERTYRRKDGTMLPVLIEDRLLLDTEGRIIGIRSTIQDITDRKRAEAEKETLQEQLRQSQKMEAIGQLAGGVAHDFNNLLTVIKGYSQLSLAEMKEEDPFRENIEEIKKSADRAADLTRQLLAFSRRQMMEMKVLDLNDSLRNLDKMLRRVIGEDIEMVTVLAEDLGGVKTDPGQIEQVILNLSVNAKDAMPHGGKLIIETANVGLDEKYARNHIAVKPGRYVMLSVSDSGMGMTQEVRDRVFEPFFTTKEKGKGTGLGLSTVYGIVKQSNGNIWVYSEPGKGTTFKIYLPRVDEPLEELKERIETKELPRGNETILLVEDDEEVRKLAMRILRGQGYDILGAAEGIEAFLLCEKHKGSIHLLVTDVVMPKMSGRELAERIASIRPEIKVLYMSGYTDNAIVHHGVLAEGVNYIQKPFTVESMARKVREVLDKE